MATIDDLNTQVAGLSANVADLLAAVNVQKSYIDGAGAEATAQVTLANAAALAAAASYDSFDDRYLGAKALAPTLDNDGNALLAGAIYFNTAVNSWNAWNGSTWVAAPAAIAAASTVSNTPAGNVAATTVQSAINELDAEKVQATTLAASGGAALVGNTPSGTTAATTVQAAINEIALDVEGKVNSHGFPINSSGAYLCTLTYNETTRTVTISPTASTFDVYVKGVKYTKTGAQTIVHSAAGTGFFIYYDDTGTLISSTTLWDETQVAPVAYVFQDVTNSRRICFEERHHAESNVYWHRNQHINEGTKASGTISATGYTLLDGSTDTAVTFGINTLRIEDEDIRIDTQALPDNGPYTILERSGASGAWVITRTNTLPFLFSGNVLQYNQNNAGTWQRTNMAEDTFVNYYVFGVTSLPTTDITPAPTTTQQIVIIAGQTTYATQALASAETFASISWGTIPFQELVPLFQYTLRFNAANPAAYTNTARCAIQTFTRTVGTAAQITQAVQTDHGSLIGLSDLDHPASAIINTPAGNIAATDVQAALNELDAEKAKLNGDGEQDFAVKSLNGGYLSGMRNRIINGDMRIDQRNAGASVNGHGVYTVDRFLMAHSGTPSFSCQRSTTAPAGFTNSLVAQVTSAGVAGVGEFNTIKQAIEGYNVADLGYGTAGAKSVTLSFWVRSSITGTYTIAFRNTGTRIYIATYTINTANTFEYKTITIVGDTAGTWATDNTSGLEVWWDLGSGASYNTTAGSWQAGNFLRTASSANWIGTLGATFYLTGVQLEVGSVATPFEVRDYGDEFRRCQRYYQTLTNLLVGGNTTSGIQVFMDFPLPVPMRIAPTGTVLTAVTYSNASSYAFNTTATDMFRLSVIILSTGYGYGYNAKLGFTSEL